MDGNRRWARAHLLPQLEGHRRGYAKVKEVARWCKRRGISVATFYAFSTENWGRAPEEVQYLMGLNRLALGRDLPELTKEGSRLKVIGMRGKPLPEDLVRLIEEAERTTAGNDQLLIQVALNYGGRAEIVDAVARIIRDGVPADRVDEALISRYLWTGGTPDPDLVIRTSGEIRLSGFLTWQSVYAEWFFTATCWPAFSEAEFDAILQQYAERQRRFGQ